MSVQQMQQTAQSVPELPFDLIEPLLTFALHHPRPFGDGGGHDVRKHLHTVLTVTAPSSTMTRAAQCLVSPVQAAVTFAQAGDLVWLQRLTRRFNPQWTPTLIVAFWTAVQHNQVAVMDWWAKCWPVMSPVDRIGLPKKAFAVSTAVKNKAYAALEWLVDHPDLVKQACQGNEDEFLDRCAVGAIADTALADVILNGHADLARRWVRARYEIVDHELRHHRVWPRDKYTKVKVPRLMEVICEQGLVDMLRELAAAGTVYTAMVEAYAVEMVEHAIHHVQMDALAWWFSEANPWQVEALDLVAVASASQQPIMVLDWWKASAMHSRLQVLPLTFDTVTGQDPVPVLDWLRRTGLPVVYTSKAMDNASRTGNVAVLAWWKASGLPLKYTQHAMDHACNVTVLDWWLSSGLELKYSSDALMFASQQGKVDVLDWWKASGVPLKYTAHAMDDAPNATVLDWWIRSGLPLKYTTASMDEARSLQVLDWWKRAQVEHGLELKYTARAMDRASCLRDFSMLNWWKDSGLEMRANGALLAACREQVTELVDWWMQYAQGTLLDSLATEAWAAAFRSGDKSLLEKCRSLQLPVTQEPKVIDECANPESLEWWESEIDSLPFVYSERALALASEQGRVDLLEWWDASGLELLYDATAMDSASANGHAKVLEWWFLSGLDLEYTQAAMDQASANGHICVLNWWLDSGLDLKYTEAAMDQASAKGRIKSLKWWVKSGLPLKYSHKALIDPSAVTTSQIQELDGLCDYQKAKRVFSWWKESGLELPMPVEDDGVAE